MGTANNLVGLEIEIAIGLPVRLSIREAFLCTTHSTADGELGESKS